MMFQSCMATIIFITLFTFYSFCKLFSNIFHFFSTNVMHFFHMFVQGNFQRKISIAYGATE